MLGLGGLLGTWRGRRLLACRIEDSETHSAELGVHIIPTTQIMTRRCELTCH